MYGQDGLTREAIAIAVRRVGTPVCWSVNQPITEEALERLARLGSAFLLDWRVGSQSAMVKLLLTIHHDYARHFVFLDARSIGAEEQDALLKTLEHTVEVHGVIVPDLSSTFLDACCATGRFIFVALRTGIPAKELPKHIGMLLGKSRFNHRGRQNVGGMVGVEHASMFSGLEKHAREFPLLVSCAPHDWHAYSFAMQGAVTVVPGMRFIALPPPPFNGSDLWRDEYATVARQLATTMQDAIAATR